MDEDKNFRSFGSESNRIRMWGGSALGNPLEYSEDGKERLVERRRAKIVLGLRDPLDLIRFLASFFLAVLFSSSAPCWPMFGLRGPPWSLLGGSRNGGGPVHSSLPTLRHTRTTESILVHTGHTDIPIPSSAYAYICVDVGDFERAGVGSSSPSLRVHHPFLSHQERTGSNISPWSPYSSRAASKSFVRRHHHHHHLRGNARARPQDYATPWNRIPSRLEEILFVNVHAKHNERTHTIEKAQ